MWIGFIPPVWGSNGKHTLPSSNTCYPQSVEFNAFTLHVLSCHVLPLAFCMHTQRLQDHTACPCPDMSLFDSFIFLFGCQQTTRTETLSLLYQVARSRKLQSSEFIVCILILQGKSTMFCPLETEKLSKTALFYQRLKC